MTAFDRILAGFMRRPVATSSAEDYEAGEEVDGRTLKHGEYRRSPSLERPPVIDFEDTRAEMHWIDSPRKFCPVTQAA